VESLGDRLRSRMAIGVNNLALATAALLDDPLGQLERGDVARLGAGLRDRPLVRSRLGPWLTARHDVSTALFKHRGVISTPPPATGLAGLLTLPTIPAGEIDPLFGSLVSLDGAAHTRIRRLIQPAFTPRAVEGWRQATWRIAHGLIDDMPERGAVDLVDQFASPLPIAVISEMFGVPDADRPMFRRWGDQLALGLDRPRSTAEVATIRTASSEASAYLSGLVDERRRRPGDDLLSVLATSEVEGERLQDHEVLANAIFIIIAGFETTSNLLATGTLELLEHPDQLRLLSTNPEGLAPGLVEESLRYCSPVQYTYRTTIEDITLEVADPIPAGSEVFLLLAAANRDPAVFHHPDQFDITRENARNHLAFASGPHYCIGAALSRMEAEVAWRALLERRPEVASWERAGEPVPTETGRLVRGLHSLPVELGRPAGLSSRR
jgi:cytochrome P450